MQTSEICPHSVEIEQLSHRLQQQLDEIWNEVRSGPTRPLFAPGNFYVLPVIIVDNEVVQVLNVPIKGTESTVYARKPGGLWIELP